MLCMETDVIVVRKHRFVLILQNLLAKLCFEAASQCLGLHWHLHSQINLSLTE